LFLLKNQKKIILLLSLIKFAQKVGAAIDPNTGYETLFPGHQDWENISNP